MSNVKILNAVTNTGERFATSLAVLVENPTKNMFSYKSIRNRAFTAVIDTRQSPDTQVNRGKLRIFFDNPTDVEGASVETTTLIAEPKISDEELENTIDDKFFSVRKFAEAASRLKIRSLLVSGTAGTGKSYECMSALEKREAEDKNFHYSIVKGTISPIALYMEMYNCKDGVLVLDDCDQALLDNESLQLLKAATESHKNRKVSYRKMSKVLEEYGIPTEFNFQGAVIILTNTDLEKAGKGKAPHFEALLSRAHFVNAVLNSTREKLIRIRSVIKNSNILSMYLSTEDEKQDVIDYIEENHKCARELSVRTVVKIAELRGAFPDYWRRLANSTIRNRS